MTSVDFRKLDAYHRREKILDTACNLFSSKGYDAVTTMELSLTVGCSETMLLGIFPTKSEIYNALFEEWKIVVSKSPTLKKINNSPLDTLERLYIDFANNKYSRDQTMRPNLEKALYSRTSDGAKKKMYKVAASAPDFVANAILPLVLEGQKRGEIISGNAAELANLVWVIAQGSHYSKKDFPERFKSIPLNLIRNILSKK